MQLALSLDTCVPLAPQHDFPPAKDELAANTPAANNAKVVLIMHLRQHELRNVQWAVTAPSPQLRHRGSAEISLKLRDVIPSRGDDEGPRYVSGRCKLASVISAVFVRSLACARDDAYCKATRGPTEATCRGFAAGSLRLVRDDYFNLNSILPFLASAMMVCPSPNFPSRMLMLSGSRSRCWIARFNGRAP